MAQEFNSHLRATLVKLLHAAQSKVSATKFIDEIQRHKEKFPKKYLQTILLDIIKVDKVAEKIYKELEKEIKSDVPAGECLYKFLTNYDKTKYNRKVSSRQNIDTIKEDEEVSTQQKGPKPPVATQNHPTVNKQPPSDPNGNVSEVTTENVKEILKKVVQAAHESSIKSTQSSITSPPTQKSALQESIQNNNIPQPVENGRIHSQMFFNKAIMDSLPSQVITPNCVARSVNEQERILIQDLIYCFIGLPGDFVTPQFDDGNDNGVVTFKISDQIDVSLRNIVQDILPLANHFSVVQKFVQWSSNAKNQILQALSEVLQSILNDHRVSVTQLEQEHMKNALNLHKLLYLIRPNMQKLQILAELVRKVAKSDLQGGSILSLLFDEITLQTGDSMSQKMLIELTERASVPYIEMLERWILKGVIIDPYNQFFIIDHGLELGNQALHHMDDYDTARYWECKYTVQSDRIPRFLESDADVILRTGKYLNVIRQCGKQISPPAGKSKLEFSATSHKHSIFIKQAYQNASKTLLELFSKENNLMGHISSVKRYFLLQQGDLITQFMEASEVELSKNVDKVTPVCLDNLLQLIVRMSSAKNDPCLEHLHCDLFTMDLARQMSIIHENGSCDEFDPELFANDASSLDLTGMECFSFKYSVHWPISIVLNQWVLSQYQMLFRLLFYCKHVDHQLCKAWVLNIEMCKSNPKVKKDQWRNAFALRQRMLHAIQHLEYYMMIEVIEPNWHIFIEKMKNVSTIDDVITIHQDFLHVCLQSCMLQHPNLLQSLMKICNVCLNFCKIIRKEATNVETIEKEFDDLLVAFIKALGEQSADTTSTAKFVHLVCRLNFNSFYN